MPTTKTAPHLINIRAFQRMISRICRRFIQDVCWRLSQLHPIALKPQVTNPRDIISIIILDKQRQTLHLAKESSFDRDILDLGRLREDKFLGGRKITCGGEIDVVAVYEDFEGLRS